MKPQFDNHAMQVRRPWQPVQVIGRPPGGGSVGPSVQTTNQSDEPPFIFVFCVIFIGLMIYAKRRWRPSQTAFGTARWASEAVLKAAGFLSDTGLILGRSLGGKLIRIRNYCHILLVGPTGSGKGVSIIIPQMLTYRGSVIVHDTKGDLWKTTAPRRAAMGQRLIRLAPYSEGQDAFNVLDLIRKDSQLLVDEAKALAAALVVKTGMETDEHWNSRAEQTISAVIVLALMRFEGEERSLNAVCEVLSDHELLGKSAVHLCKMGGIPARLGQQLKSLFDNEGLPTKEGSGILSTVSRHLSFMDSELVGKAIASSTFDVRGLLEGNVSLFIEIPPLHLEAAKGLLRLWLTSLFRFIGQAGDERAGEVLCLLDEASALEGLSSIEEALVRGRSSGLRLLLAYQSDTQVQAAFKGKPTLIYDNCSSQIYMVASSIETAERLCKSIGEFTQCVESYGENSSKSRQYGGGKEASLSLGTSQGQNHNFAVQGRALIRPEEILTLSDEYLITLQRSMPPILATRVKWYEKRAFARSVSMGRGRRLGWWLFGLLAAWFVLAMIHAQSTSRP